MIAINMEYFEINREYISSKKFIVNCIYIILCLFTIIINGNYKRKNENRVQEEVQVEVEEKVEDKVEEVKVEEVASLEKVEEVASLEKVEEVKVEEVASLEKVEEVKVEEKVKEKVEDETVASLEIVAELTRSNEVEEKDVNTWYTIEDGKCRYKGEWKNGMPNGKGIKHFYKTDSYIEGNFVDSFAHGYGKQTFEQTWEKTQPYYEGEFNRNNYDGKGEYHFGDGDYYKGMWKNNKYHGQGAAYSKYLNRTWVGEYKNDEKGEGNWVKGEI